VFRIFPRSHDEPLHVISPAPKYSGSDRGFGLRAGIARLSNGRSEHDRHVADDEMSITYIRTKSVKPRNAMRAFWLLQARKFPFLTGWAALGLEEMPGIVSIYCEHHYSSVLY
jgi:hypothetical protein